LKSLSAWLTDLEGRLPPFRSAPIWEPRFVERLVVAGFDAHEAVLSKTGDKVLALKAMTLWVSAFEARLKSGDEAPAMELAVTSDTWPVFDDDDGPTGRAELSPEAAAALDELIEDAMTFPFEADDVAWMETTTHEHEASRVRSQTAPVPRPQLE
jgi:hypothetical protein